MRRRIIQRGRDLLALTMSVGVIAVTVKAINRMMAREVMLFAGGASFFGLLALFPAVLVGITLYGLIFSEEDTAAQLASLQMAEVLPAGAQTFLENQLVALTATPALSLTLQGIIAALILLFAAARGAKAIIAGLNQIARRGDLRNVLHFNLIALALVLVGVTLLVGSNLIVLAVPNIIRPAFEMLGLQGLDFTLLFNEWTTAAASMSLGLLLLYRYVMQRAGETSWRASLTGAVVSTGLWLAMSKGFSVYVSTIVNPTTYGPLGALIVFLLWVYWGAYVVFFGGALAIEIDRRSGRLVGDAGD